MSTPVSVTHDGMVSTVTFAHPPFNLMDVAVLDALRAAHLEADAHPETRVVVTRSALEGMFSNGISPLAIVEGDAAVRVAIFSALGKMVHAIYGMGKPHITAINGPAMAGGAVLAILSDFRYLEAERGRMSFAECKVGVPLPEGLISIIRAVCAPSALAEVVLMAKNCDAQDALACGLVTGVAPSAELEAVVAKQCERLARLSPAVLRATKGQLRKDLLERTATMISGAAVEVFTPFLGEAFLGEGLQAFLEGRPPVFVK